MHAVESHCKHTARVRPGKVAADGEAGVDEVLEEPTSPGKGVLGAGTAPAVGDCTGAAASDWLAGAGAGLLVLRCAA